MQITMYYVRRTMAFNGDCDRKVPQEKLQVK